MGTWAQKDALPRRPGDGADGAEPGARGAGPAEWPQLEPDGAGGPRCAFPFLAWSAAEVAEWVVQLGFPQYEVRGSRPGREAHTLTAT